MDYPDNSELLKGPGHTILDEAKGLIYGDREEQYGSALESFGNIAKGWSTIAGTTISPLQVCLMMDWLKTCRLMNQHDHHDSVVDKAGYSGCYEKVLKELKRQDLAEKALKAALGTNGNGFSESAAGAVCP